MIFSTIICGLTLLFLVLSLIFKPSVKFKSINISLYWIIALIGAIILISFKFVPFDLLISKITANSEINPLKLLVLFFSMTVMSVFLDEVGFFKIVANYALKKCKTSQIKLFTILYCLVSILTVFTSNDIIILTFTPFILFFSKNAKISPTPYLVAEFVGANTLSMALIIGNPTNIYIATSYAIDFSSYFIVMLIPTIISAVVAYLILRLVFKSKLSNIIEPQILEIKPLDKFLLYFGIIMLFSCIIMFALSSYLKFEMWYVSLFSCSFLFFVSFIYCLIKKKHLIVFKNIFKRLPWELIPFVLSMFTIVSALSHANLSTKICEILGNDNTEFTYGFISFLSANLLNNIPMSMFFTEVLSTLTGKALIKGVYATIIGSNIGAYLTPIGALAGIMWLKILKENGESFSFKDFIKYGIIISLPTITVAILTLSLSLNIFL